MLAASSTFVFDCDGKTVGDFVTAMNAIMIADYDAHLFSFCLGSSDAANVPADKIINVSSEMFQQWIATDNSAFDPQDDNTYKFSGADLSSVPLGYGDMHTRAITNLATNSVSSTEFDAWDDSWGNLIPMIYNVSVNYDEDLSVMPPPFMNLLNENYTIAGDPSQNSDVGLVTAVSFGDPTDRTRTSPNLWWTNIVGWDREVIQVRLNESEELLDPFDS